MSWKDLFFEKVEVKDDDKQPEIKKVETGGSGKTTFQRRLPSLGGNNDSEQSTPSSSANTSYVPAPSTALVVPRVDTSKFHAHFDSVIEGAGLPVPNYYTFAQMLAEMGDLPDNAKYKGAFTALKVQGVTKQSLIGSAQAYLNLLDQDKAGFKKEALDTQKQSKDQIEAVNNLVQQNNAAIDKARTDTDIQIKQLQEARDMRIRQLQNEIDANKAKVAPLQQEADTINARIDLFERSCEDYKSVINSDVQKIQNIIQ